jgi:spermidine synthase
LSLAYAYGHGGASFQIARVLVAALVVGIPAFAMGATYPLIVRAARIRAGAAASLYAANTAGAATGAIAAGFVLLRLLGVMGTTLVGATGNLLVAAIAWRLDPRDEDRPVGAQPRPRPARGTTETHVPAALAATAVAGFAALVLELVWTRTLAMIIGPTTYAFSAMVGCFIAGLAVGSAGGAAAARRTAKPLAWLASLFGLAALTTAAAMSLVDNAVLDVARRAADPDARLATLLAAEIRWALLLVGPAAACFGALFPMALAVAGDASPRTAARVYGANTLGAIAGSLAGGLLILPSLGLRGTFALVVGVTSAAALWSIAPIARRSLALTGAVLAICGAAVAAAGGAAWNPKLLSSGAYKYAAYLGEADLGDLLQAGTLRYYREGATGTVAVRDLTGVRSLSIDGKVDASNGGDMLTQRLLAHIPLLTHGRAARVAIVGLGSGVTLGSALTHPVRSADVIEISPEVVEAARWFTRENRDALRDPRVRLIEGDARTHFRLSRGAAYDVVISEPSNPWMAGVAALFTREFFESLRDRLAPGGVVCQWTHTYDLSRDDLRSIVATFAHVFPEVAVWLVGDGDLLMVGSAAAGGASASRAVRAVASQSAAADLAASGIRSSTDLEAFYIGDGAFARRWSAGATLQVDDRMALEFSAPAGTVGATREDNTADLLLSADVKLPADPQRRRDVGVLLLNAQAPRRAWTHLSAAIAALSDDPGAVSAFVKAAAASGRLAEAERTLAELVSTDPAPLAARLEYAKLLAARGDVETARRHAAAAAAHAPGNPAAHEELAAIAADVEDVEGLRVAVAWLRAQRPDAPRTLYYDGVLRLLTGRPAEAQELARRAVAADPAHAAAWNLLGAALGAAEAPPDKIRTAFERAVAADPSDPAAYVNLATLELNTGRTAEALDWFAQAVTVDPDNAAARRGLSSARAPR